MTIRYYRDKREKQGSKHTLGILNEYGKSKPRVWVEYGWSMVRVWLEANILFPRWEQNIPTLGTKHSHVGNKTGLRLVIMLLLMMICGVSEVWGQTPDRSGYYYISNYKQKGHIPPSTKEIDGIFYLCPSTSLYAADKPFVTDYMTDKDANSIWDIEYVSSSDNVDYYHIKHHSSSKYLKTNEQLVSNNADRVRVHLETATATDFNNDTDGDFLFFFIAGTGNRQGAVNVCPKTLSSRSNGASFAPAKGNKNDYAGVDQGTPGSFTGYDGNTIFCGGLIGVYNYNDDNSFWCLENAQCATPTITCSSGEVTITSTEGATIYYTTDGSTTPDPEHSGGVNATQVYNSESKPTVSVTTTIKAIAVKTNMVNSEVITQTIVVNPVIDPIASVTYNGSEQEPAVTVKDGETPIDEDEYEVTYTNNKNVGTATVTITDKEGGDYIVYGSTTFTIAKAPVTVTADAKTKGYGDADPELTFTTTALQGSDTQATAFTGALTRESGEAKGTYAISQGTLASANYEISFTGAYLTITNKTLTITAGSDSKVYDGTALTNNTYTNTSLLAGDAIESVTVSGSQTNAGSSANVPSGAVIKNGSNENVTANYEITYVNGTLTVTPRPVTITADSDTKEYDGTALTKNTYTNTALLEGHSLTSVTVTGSQTAAGTSDNVPSAAVIMNGETDVTGNYAPTYVNGTLEVTQKALTITAGSDTKVYDGTPLTKSTYTNTALATGDAIESVTFTGSQTAVGSSNNVPSAAVIKNGSDETVTASYDITYTNGTLSVTQASVTVTANNASKVYGEEDPASFTATITGLVNNESESLISISTVSRASGENVGTYAITPAGDASQGNYTVNYLAGTFTITPKALGDGTRAAEGMTITMTDNGSGGYTVMVKDGATTLTEDTHYTLTEEDDVVTITGIGNYSGSARLVYANAAFATPDEAHVPSEDGYAAVYVSAMDVLAPAAVKVYVVKKVNATIGTVTVTEIGYIPEGVPVLLMADDNQTGFAASPVDFNETTPISDAVRNSNKLQVAPANGVTVAATEAYVLYKGEFVLTLAGTISQGKIFLYNPNYTGTPAPSPAPSPARYLRIVVEEEDPDGISEELRVKNEELATDDAWYTLDGRLIDNSKIQNSKMPKGMYITNGRKVIIK